MAIAIMSHPIPSANESHLVQLILPQKQLGRRSDMYLFCCSCTHNVVPKGKFIAFVSTVASFRTPCQNKVLDLCVDLSAANAAEE